MGLVILVTVVVVLAYRAMSKRDRGRFVQSMLQQIRRLEHAINLRYPELQSFHSTLHARTPFAPVTPVLIVTTITVFVVMLWAPHSPSDPDTLVQWGGNFGPRMAAGDWWRVATAMFVHASWFHLFASVCGLMQVGLILERLVGPVAFASAYAAAGLLSSAIHVSSSPMVVNVGASGAIFGTYGLMLAALIAQVLRRSLPIMPMTAAKRIAPAIVVFVLYNLATQAVVTVAELGGFIAGLACGPLIAGSTERKASIPRIAAAVAIMVLAAVMVAAPVRVLADVVDLTPAVKELITIEERTATAFRAAADRFGSGRITAEGLAEVIDRDIMPVVKAGRAHIQSLANVSTEQHTLVAACHEYLRLRQDSWRIRSAAFRQGSVPMLREADGIERRSLEILRQITSRLHDGELT